MKPKNLYKLKVGTLVYITSSIFDPTHNVAMTNLPVIQSPNHAAGTWRLTKDIIFTEDDRTGPGPGQVIEMFRLPNKVNDILKLTRVLPLYLVVDKDEMEIQIE